MVCGFVYGVQGRSQKSGEGGAKILDRKPHLLINPRCACAATVTVLGLCVCLSACVCLSPLILALQAPNRLMSDTNGSSATSARKIMWRFR